MNRRTRDRRASPRYSEVVVGGLKTARLSRQGMAALMVDDCLASRRRERTPRLIFTANGHSIALAATDAKFRAQLKAANLIHADGQPVVWASKMTRSPIPERTATTDFIHDAAAQAQKHG
ncbi:MAG TPA: WecB/TagA/CpsF family glycosyltransferase, partial [Rhizomicrobium sp.]|nr:WecB/TagA/CpsF family glycosyltransferase [Rhizomicrobium sp.]